MPGTEHGRERGHANGPEDTGSSAGVARPPAPAGQTFGDLAASGQTWGDVKDNYDDFAALAAGERKVTHADDDA